MRTLSLDLVDQGVDGRPQTWRCRDQRQRQRTQRSQALAQTGDHRFKAAQIAEALAFGAVAQALADTARLVRPQGVDEQPGLADHAIALRGACW
jgi:hypothetical protein